jgi:hypothetical protein
MQPRSGLQFQPSSSCKLAQKKAAARGSRRESREREAGRNRVHPQDFAIREPLRASMWSAIAEGRTSVDELPGGRRTSIRGSYARLLQVTARCAKYTPTRSPASRLSLLDWHFQTGGLWPGSEWWIFRGADQTLSSRSRSQFPLLLPEYARKPPPRMKATPRIGGSGT